MEDISPKIKLPEITIVNDARNYSNDPGVMQHFKETVAFLKKAGMPKSYTDEHGELDLSAYDD